MAADTVTDDRDFDTTYTKMKNHLYKLAKFDEIGGAMQAKSLT